MISYCLQVDLKFPKNISDGARDLISKLLRHNPVDRLPLQSVIDHPWVRANSRRVLPPVCPGNQSWARLVCLPPTEGCFICPPQETGPACFGVNGMGFKLPLYQHIVWLVLGWFTHFRSCTVWCPYLCLSRGVSMVFSFLNLFVFFILNVHSSILTFCISVDTKVLLLDWLKLTFL